MKKNVWKHRAGTEEMLSDYLPHMNLKPALGDPPRDPFPTRLPRSLSEASEVLQAELAPDTGCVRKTKTRQLPLKGWQSRGKPGPPVHKTSMPQAVSPMEKPDGEQNNYWSNSGKPAVAEKAYKEICSISFENQGVRTARGSKRTVLAYALWC